MTQNNPDFGIKTNQQLLEEMEQTINQLRELLQPACQELVKAFNDLSYAIGKAWADYWNSLPDETKNLLYAFAVENERELERLRRKERNRKHYQRYMERSRSKPCSTKKSRH